MAPQAKAGKRLERTVSIPSTPPAAPDDDGWGERVRREVDRAIARQVKGLELISPVDQPVGLTPKDVIYSCGTMKLYHYRPTTDEVYRVPLLIVYSLVNKPYILDLAPGQSLVEFLVNQGYDVYLVDWGIPRPEDSHLRLEDYLLDLLPRCVEKVREASGETELNMIGYCMGGQFAAMYAALNPDGPLRALACFTTPVNMQEMGLMARWSDRRYFDVDRIVDTLGNVPPEILVAAFDMLRPASRTTNQVRLWDNLWNDEFVKSFRMLDRWGTDQIPIPGEVFRQVVKEMMWENKFAANEMEVAGRRVDLSRVTVPFLHVVAEHDHIVPYASAKQLVPMVGSEDKEELMIKGGHVSLVAGGNAVFRLWPKLDRWLSRRSA
jgi:polyhydroxyalkanoate synthase